MALTPETAEHREKRLASMREYAARNKEAISARKKAYKLAKGALTLEKKHNRLCTWSNTVSGKTQKHTMLPN